MWEQRLTLPLAFLALAVGVLLEEQGHLQVHQVLAWAGQTQSAKSKVLINFPKLGIRCKSSNWFFINVLACSR